MSHESARVTLVPDIAIAVPCRLQQRVTFSALDKMSRIFSGKLARPPVYTPYSKRSTHSHWYSHTCTQLLSLHVHPLMVGTRRCRNGSLFGQAAGTSWHACIWTAVDERPALVWLTRILECLALRLAVSASSRDGSPFGIALNGSCAS